MLKIIAKGLAAYKVVQVTNAVTFKENPDDPENPRELDPTLKVILVVIVAQIISGISWWPKRHRNNIVPPIEGLAVATVAGATHGFLRLLMAAGSFVKTRSEFITINQENIPS